MVGIGRALSPPPQQPLFRAQGQPQLRQTFLQRLGQSPFFLQQKYLYFHRDLDVASSLHQYFIIISTVV